MAAQELQLAYERAKAAAAVAEAEYQQLKNAANSSNFKLPEQQAEFLAARKTASDFKTNVLDPAKVAEDDAFSALQNAQTTTNAEKDQGPRTASAGDIQQEGSNARDEGATTQNPPGATLVVKQEDINSPVDIGPAPATTTGTNADKTETSEDVPGDKPTPDKLPNGSAPVTPASTSNGASATPGQNTGGLQPSGQSQATQTYIYRAKEVTHVFDRGRFTQELVGSLIVFPYPPGEEKKKDASQAKNDDAAQGDSQTQTQTALRRDPAPKTNLSPKIASEKLGTNVNAGKSNTLANALTLPPTSGGQPVAPRTFAEDVAQRKQTIITPQQINREP